MNTTGGNDPPLSLICSFNSAVMGKPPPPTPSSIFVWLLTGSLLRSHLCWLRVHHCRWLCLSQEAAFCGPSPSFLALTVSCPLSCRVPGSFTENGRSILVRAEHSRITYSQHLVQPEDCFGHTVHCCQRPWGSCTWNKFLRAVCHLVFWDRIGHLPGAHRPC